MGIISIIGYWYSVAFFFLVYFVSQIFEQNKKKIHFYHSPQVHLQPFPAFGGGRAHAFHGPLPGAATTVIRVTVRTERTLRWLGYGVNRSIPFTVKYSWCQTKLLYIFYGYCAGILAALKIWNKREFAHKYLETFVQKLTA